MKTLKFVPVNNLYVGDCEQRYREMVEIGIECSCRASTESLLLWDKNDYQEGFKH